MKSIYGVMIACAMSFNAFSETITIKAQDGFSLVAEYTPAAYQSDQGAFLIHQCGADKSMYAKLAKLLAQQGINTFAIDMRGYGASINDSTSFVKFEQQDNRTKWRKMAEIAAEFATSDTLAAYQTFIKLSGSKYVFYAGASCGGALAIELAQKHAPRGFIFFSAAVQGDDLNDFIKLDKVPALIVAAKDDTSTFAAAGKLFAGAQDENSQLISYKGKQHGFPLFDQDKNLVQVMAAFVLNNINN